MDGQRTQNGLKMDSKLRWQKWAKIAKICTRNKPNKDVKLTQISSKNSVPDTFIDTYCNATSASSYAAPNCRWIVWTCCLLSTVGGKAFRTCSDRRKKAREGSLAQICTFSLILSQARRTLKEENLLKFGLKLCTWYYTLSSRSGSTTKGATGIADSSGRSSSSDKGLVKQVKKGSWLGLVWSAWKTRHEICVEHSSGIWFWISRRAEISNWEWKNCLKEMKNVLKWYNSSFNWL